MNTRTSPLYTQSAPEEAPAHTQGCISNSGREATER